MSNFNDPVYFDKFQTYCLMKDGTMVDSVADLTIRAEELEPYVSSFIVECPDVSRSSSSSLEKISNTHKRAIKISLMNSIFKRRKSYEQTFCSELFFTHTQCADILQKIETDARFKGDPSVTGSNPLVGILGLNEGGYRWSSLIRNKEHIPNVYASGAFTDQDLDINMYHPYVWYLLERERYYEIKQFLSNKKTMESFMKYLSKK